MTAPKNISITRLTVASALVVVILASGLGIVKRQAVSDWLQLRGYKPSITVTSLAMQDTMTAEARHLFYVNHPLISNGRTFTDNCPSGAEKTIVLGCYRGNDAGIYVYDVTDSRLDGVEQVTAAHEMLHAAYRRLSPDKRATVDAMLEKYYHDNLTDSRIKDTIAAYKISEPNDVVNEMHSIFGTEIAQLPSGLETYYKQYFVNRQAVAGFAAQYQAEFTSRQTQVAADDSQLKILKTQINANETSLRNQKTSIDNQSAQLTAQRDNNPSAYNAAVPAYNAAVSTYNQSVAATKNLIDQYNALVQARNNIVLEEEQLTQAITAQAQPTTE